MQNLPNNYQSVPKGKLKAFCFRYKWGNYIRKKARPNYRDVIILATSKKEAIEHLSYKEDFSLSKIEIVKRFYIHDISISVNNKEEHYINNVSYQVLYEEGTDYYQIEHIHFAEDSKDTLDELKKIFLNQIKNTEFKYDY
jgi:hypothetical protein